MSRTVLRRLPTQTITFLLGACLAADALASSYGVYDARALAMAGTAVGVGNVNQAHHYNPSLIAFHSGHEDRTRDGRHSVALIANRMSDGARAAAEAIEDDLEGELVRAVDQLNAAPTPQAALAGIDAATKLERAMRDLQGKDIEADGYVGYSVTLPADGEGGAFFVGTRLLGAGTSQIADDDFELLEDYAEALQFIASEGAEGAEHPELFNEAGQLYDPSSWIESSASGAGVAQTEVGVSAAKQWQVWGVPLAFGVTPKFVYLQSYSENWRTVEDNFNSSSFDKRTLLFNMDMGATAVFKQHFRVALAVKDMRSHSFRSANQRIELRPRTRLGLAYHHSRLRLGLDLDLHSNNNLHTLEEQRMLSVGAEFKPISLLQLRFGFQQDLERPGGATRMTAGLSVQLGRLETELAMSKNEIGDGAALQFSFYH